MILNSQEWKKGEAVYNRWQKGICMLWVASVLCILGRSWETSLPSEGHSIPRGINEQFLTFVCIIIQTGELRAPSLPPPGLPCTLPRARLCVHCVARLPSVMWGAPIRTGGHALLCCLGTVQTFTQNLHHLQRLPLGRAGAGKGKCRASVQLYLIICKKVPYLFDYVLQPVYVVLY